jgi:ubiquinone/menaquinone biosynthesis C-methylase UbiE
MNLRELAEFYRLSRRRLQSENDYRRFQSFQARLLIRYLAANDVDLYGRTLLDLGSGIGGYSREFVENGARVISVDLVQPRLLRDFGISQVQGSALNIPLCDESVDMVFCASLIEHVARPAVILTETARVLKKGGACYMSFPPYYNPTGGHEYAPFHYLGERLAMRLVRRRSVVPQWVYQYYDLAEQPTSFAELSAGWGLYRMTIRKFRRLAARTQLKLVNVSTRYWPISFIRWPLLGEVLTWHAQFILIKLYNG